MLTLKELAEAIFKLPVYRQAGPAVVYPPEGCPAQNVVPVTELGIIGDGQVVMLTGKKPT